MEAALNGLLLLTPTLLAYAILGMLVGQILAVIPGLGGIFPMVILMPYIYTMDPEHAIALLLGASVTSGTGNSVSGILFGVPATATGVAVMFDGYPMSQKGLAQRALAAGLTASAAGGIIGALALALMIPVARPLVLALGPAEFALLVLLALLILAFLRQRDPIKAMLSGGLGLLLSFVGQETSTATLRYTLGSTYLWDGIAIVPFVMGVFAISEMIDLFTRGGAIARSSVPFGSGHSQTLQGVLDVRRHWAATVRSSLTGVVVGIIPGLGGETAQFLSYAQGARTSKRGQYFGTGEVEGVIVADASNNSKEGGALLPTLAFGIPGSASMVVLLAAFVTLGVQPGTEMLTTHLHIVWMTIFILIITSILASVLVMAGARHLAKLTFVDVGLIIPAVLIASVIGAYASSFHSGDIVTVLLFGLVGYLFKSMGYPRVLLVMGYVLGPILEHHYILALQLYGWSFATRPPSIVLLLAIVVMVVSSFTPRGKAARSQGGMSA